MCGVGVPALQEMLSVIEAWMGVALSRSQGIPESMCRGYDEMRWCNEGAAPLRVVRVRVRVDERGLFEAGGGWGDAEVAVGVELDVVAEDDDDVGGYAFEELGGLRVRGGDYVGRRYA